MCYNTKSAILGQMKEHLGGKLANGKTQQEKSQSFVIIFAIRADLIKS